MSDSSDSNIQVFVRVRPFNTREEESSEKAVVQITGKKTSLLDPKKEYAKVKTFEYSKSFQSSFTDRADYATQNDVYKVVGNTILDNAFEGYNSCLLAYGQTGSGKTYTMMGNLKNSDEVGCIPRLCANLFARVEALKSATPSQFKIEASYCEIYNEKINCLLKGAQGLQVRNHPTQGTYVEGLPQKTVKNMDSVVKLMSEGNDRRSTAATKMNDRSSRSHAIFTLYFTHVKIRASNKSEVETKSISSKIHLVDLAGSERIKHSGVSGQQLEEAKSINLSLTTLGRVIESLINTNKTTTIPYRESSLTWILANSFGGNSKTIMVATISPSSINFDETHNTLRYADRTTKVVNKVVKNVKNERKLLADIQADISGLQLELDSIPCQLLEKEDEIASLNEKLELQQGLVHELAQQRERWETHGKNETKLRQSLLDRFETLEQEHSEKSRAVQSLTSNLKGLQMELVQKEREFEEEENKLLKIIQDKDYAICQLKQEKNKAQPKADPALEQKLKEALLSVKNLEAKLETSKKQQKSQDEAAKELAHEVAMQKEELSANQAKIQQLKAEKEASQKDVQRLESEQKTEQKSTMAKLNEMSAQNKSLVSQNEQNEQALAKKTNELKKLTEANKQTEAKVVELVEELKAKEANVSTLDAHLAKAREAAKASGSEREAKINELMDTSAQLAREVAIQKEELHVKTDKLKEAVAEKEASHKEIQDISIKFAVAEHKLVQYTADMAKLEERSKAIAEEFKSQEARLQSLGQEIMDWEKKHLILELEKKEADTELARNKVALEEEGQKSKVLSAEIKELKANLHGQSSSIAELEESLRSATKKCTQHAALESGLKVEKANLEKLNADLKTSHDTAMEGLNSILEVKQKQIETAKQDMSMLSTQNETLEKEKRSLKHNITDLTATLEEMQGKLGKLAQLGIEIQNSNRKLADAEVRLSESQANLANSRSEIADLSSENNDLKVSLQEAKKEIQSYSNELSLVNAEYTLAKETLENLELNKSMLESEIKSEENNFASIKKMLEDQIEDLTETDNQMVKELEDVMTAKKQVETQLEEANKDLAEKSKYIQTLEEAKDNILADFKQTRIRLEQYKLKLQETRATNKDLSAQNAEQANKIASLEHISTKLSDDFNARLSSMVTNSNEWKSMITDIEAKATEKSKPETPSTPGTSMIGSFFRAASFKRSASHRVSLKNEVDSESKSGITCRSTCSVSSKTEPGQRLSNAANGFARRSAANRSASKPLQLAMNDTKAHDWDGLDSEEGAQETNAAEVANLRLQNKLLEANVQGMLQVMQKMLEDRQKESSDEANVLANGLRETNEMLEIQVEQLKQALEETKDDLISEIEHGKLKQNQVIQLEQKVEILNKRATVSRRSKSKSLMYPEDSPLGGPTGPGLERSDSGLMRADSGGLLRADSGIMSENGRETPTQVIQTTPKVKQSIRFSSPPKSPAKQFVPGLVVRHRIVA